MYEDDDPRIYRPNDEPDEDWEETVILPSELTNPAGLRREIIRQRKF